MQLYPEVKASALLMDMQHLALISLQQRILAEFAKALAEELDFLGVRSHKLSEGFSTKLYYHTFNVCFYCVTGNGVKLPPEIILR